jgi:hypothetical protein
LQRSRRSGPRWNGSPGTRGCCSPSPWPAPARARAWGWPGALAGGAGFLLFRFVAGTSAAVLATEAVGTAMALGAGLLARRAGPWAEASAVSAAALLALLL